MLASDLITIFRSHVDDIDRGHAQNLLWSDDEILRYIDFAQNEAARRAKLIRDSTTAAVCSIPFVINQATYSMHSSILRVEEVNLALTGAKLAPTNARDLDFVRPTWRTTASAGAVTHYMINWQPKAITFHQIPTALGDSVNLSVIRLPLVPVTDGALMLELSDDLCYKLLPGLCWQAYMKKDTQTEDPNLSKKFSDEFDRNFGGALPMNVEMEFSKSYASRRRTRSCF